MKSKKQKAAEYAAYVKEKERRETLVEAAIEKWGITECLEALWKMASREQEKDMDTWIKDQISIYKGAIIINPQSIAEADRINDMLDTLYPTCNDKQLALFAA
jgi:hypothetical protein